MGTSTKNKKKISQDLPDSKDDQKHMEQEETTMDLPEVKDIPGQEHIRPILAGEIADYTPSSADEEGEGIEGLNDDDEELDQDAADNVTTEEQELLEQTTESTASRDDQQLRQAKLDNTDEDGEPLNEEIDLTGGDLDAPGSDDEEIDLTDEENGPTSLSDDKEDPINTYQ